MQRIRVKVTKKIIFTEKVLGFAFENLPLLEKVFKIEQPGTI